MKALFLIFLAYIFLIQCVDKNKYKRCDQESWCKRHRNLKDHQIRYEIDEGTVQIIDGSVYANITEKISNTDFFLRLDLHKDNVVRLRIDETTPFQFNVRYTPKDVLLDSVQPIQITSLRKEGEYHILDITKTTQLRFTNKLQFELLESGHVVMSANSRGLLYIEHFRAKDENPPSMSQEGEGEVPLLGGNVKDAWTENFGGDVDHTKHGPQSIGMDFTFQAENVYGIPMHATDLSLKTTTGEKAQYSEPYRMYNLDVFEYELDEPMALYGHVPIMIAHSEKHTSGIYWHNCAETWVDVQKNVEPEPTKKETHTHWFSETGLLDIFFLSGPRPKDVVRQFTSLVGTQALPPMFAIAYHQCRWNYVDEEDIRKVNAKFEEHDFPMDVLWLDIEHTHEKRYFTWDREQFPNPARMIDHISSYGRKMVTIVDPHIKRDSNWDVHQEAGNRHYVRNENKDDYEGFCWSGSSSWIDFTDPKAREWWISRFNFNTYHGSTADLFVWNDMNEPSVFSGPEITLKKNAIHYDGWEHRDVHNLYGALMQRATSEGLVQRNTWCDANLRPFVLSRAFFAGSQRWGAIWTGDNKADWGHLAASQPMLLSSGLGGIAFIGADVGGFFGNPSPELLVRWYQAGSYQPFFRAHAHIDAKRREPWLFGDQPLKLMRNAVLTRYALLPYIYTLFYQASIVGTPIMRPLFMEYPNDTNTFNIQSTFLLGSDLLVTPVTTESQKIVSVYLPLGSWFDIYTHERIFGGKTIQVDAPLEKIPVFQREGSIIPRKMRVRRSTTQMESDPFTLFIALDGNQEAHGDIYMDDGKTYDYQKSGKYAYIRISYQHDQNGAVITSTRASYNTTSHGENTCELSTQSYQPVNTIEKIVMMGQKSLPRNIILYSSSDDIIGTKLSFEIDDNKHGNTLIIKKPNCLISDKWRISIIF